MPISIVVARGGISTSAFCVESDEIGGLRRYKENGKGFYFSPRLVEWLGPRREGDVADEPYIHYAAAIQKLFEDISLQLMDYYLGDIIRETGLLAFSGGGALNVKLNQKIIARPEVKELFVQPASGDSGTAVGAAGGGAALATYPRGPSKGPVQQRGKPVSGKSKCAPKLD